MATVIRMENTWTLMKEKHQSETLFRTNQASKLKMVRNKCGLETANWEKNTFILPEDREMMPNVKNTPITTPDASIRPNMKLFE